jgi:hypothetical protein
MTIFMRVFLAQRGVRVGEEVQDKSAILRVVRPTAEERSVWSVTCRNKEIYGFRPTGS